MCLDEIGGGGGISFFQEESRSDNFCVLETMNHIHWKNMTVWAQSNHYFFLLPMVQKSPSSFKGVSLRKLAVYSRNVCFPELNTKSADSVYLNIYVSNSEDMLLSSFLRIRPCNNTHCSRFFSCPPAQLLPCSPTLLCCTHSSRWESMGLWDCTFHPSSFPSPVFFLQCCWGLQEHLCICVALVSSIWVPGREVFAPSGMKRGCGGGANSLEKNSTVGWSSAHPTMLISVIC